MCIMHSLSAPSFIAISIDKIAFPVTAIPQPAVHQLNRSPINSFDTVLEFRMDVDLTFPAVSECRVFCLGVSVGDPYHIQESSSGHILAV